MYIPQRGMPWHWLAATAVLPFWLVAAFFLSALPWVRSFCVWAESVSGLDIVRENMPNPWGYVFLGVFILGYIPILFLIYKNRGPRRFGNLYLD